MSYSVFYVSKVVKVDNDFCEQVIEDYIPLENEKVFYSVYGMLENGLLDCILDRKNKDDAEKLCIILNAGLRQLKNEVVPC